ncbi:HlyD family efflux transporter periplasmic adaptor subunit [Marinilabiliaceae bacterium JC017]|nr:HlyD family efflux transporter periplasmic adaptor subunit [Marinilabiliaceae bacterium JC017]
MSKKKIIIAALLVACFVIVFMWLTKDGGNQVKVVKVCKGLFENTVECVGELQAGVAIDITIPDEMLSQEINIQYSKILDIVAEGTIVKAGDYVASLDPADLEEEITRVGVQLDEYYNNLENGKLDSSLVLMQARDAIEKAEDEVLDLQLKKEQSVFESKAMQRQIDIDCEKAKRKLEIEKRNYQQQQRKLGTQLKRFQDVIKRWENEMNLLRQLRINFRISAPSSGMLVYAKAYNNTKIKAGTMVGRWAPVIASLPDLSSIVSVLYVKEIDVAKVKVGQQVEIEVDAFPGKSFSGKITKLANIGQNIPGDNQVGFKVNVLIEPGDEILLPGMTTRNKIVVNQVEEALMVPRSALIYDDSLIFVLKKEGLSFVKTEVKVGDENKTMVHIIAGLSEKDRIKENTEL